MKVGDLVKFYLTGAFCIYMGIDNAKDCYVFYSADYGNVELWREHYTPDDWEVISESR